MAREKFCGWRETHKSHTKDGVKCPGYSGSQIPTQHTQGSQR